MGWLVTGIERVDGRVRVTMEHPRSRWPRFIDAPDEDTAVAWSMILRNGAVHWKPKKKSAGKVEPPPDVHRDAVLDKMRALARLNANRRK